MKCPICSTRLHPGADRCPNCGYRSPAAHTTYERSEHSPGILLRSCGCLCAVAAGLLVLLLLYAGLNMVRIGDGPREPVREPEVPASVSPAEDPTISLEDEPTIPAAQEGCFLVAEHTVTFLPEQWDGSPVLRVPESIGGETVTTIGPGCFRDCADLTTILLPDSVTAISPMAFDGCTGLRGLFLPKGTESIGRDAFDGCISLEAIYVPASVTYIAPGAFDDCASLLYIFYEGRFETWDALYSDYVNPFTTAICLDGNYYHGSAG